MHGEWSMKKGRDSFNKILAEVIDMEEQELENEVLARGGQLSHLLPPVTYDPGICQKFEYPKQL